MRALFDSNILIDYLNGFEAASKEIAKYESHAISVVTWMEVMAGADDETEISTRRFLAKFSVLEVTRPVAERAVRLRRERKIKLPDAIIFATAIEAGLNLVTRNTKDFSKDEPGVRIPYLR